MITIYCCNIYSKEIDEYGSYTWTYARESESSQWRYISAVNKANGIIATLSHTDSLLRKLFIESHLDEGGYIKEYGKFSLEHEGERIYYELVDKRVFKKELL